MRFLELDIHSYDFYCIQFSGGKDSISALLYLLEQGVPKEKVELWHQCVDGDGQTLFDWEITTDYCRKFAEAFGVKIHFQWKKGGFRREMLRNNTRTAPIVFELPDGSVSTAGGLRGKPSTRMRFPQVSPDLRVRWCSSYLKIDVCKASIINQERFRGKRTLIISGERGEESPQRAKYSIFEPDSADLRHGKSFSRHVDRFRPVRDWKESQVWEIIERNRVRVHPCYYMGWSRCSCKYCVFSSADQMASAAMVSPVLAEELIIYERKFGCTMKRNMDLQSFIASGKPYPSITPELISLATSSNYNLPIIIPDDEPWMLPAGAYGESTGPN